MAGFPIVRLRRLRRSAASRALVGETRLTPDRFVAPFFVRRGTAVREEIGSLPGVFRLSPELVRREAEQLSRLGIPAMILFGLPDKKDETGSEAWDDQAA